tara:strand:- start:210 stop:1058 length:849 start_codon:yes stop_codon:yes gene_type:complete
MIIDGKKIAESFIKEVEIETSQLKKKGIALKLVVILIGDYLPSKIYVKNKEKKAFQAKINSEIIKYSKEVGEDEILKKIFELNKNPEVTGILVQLPIPDHINKERVISAIDPNKDVDGFHPINVGRLASGLDGIVPCTPLGCLFLIKSVEKNLKSKHAVIIGRSNLNGKPMAQLLLREDCSVTILHSKSKDLKAECSRADILVAAVGKSNLVKSDWVKKNSIVIDVGINKEGEKIIGDVDFDEVKKVAKAITPVPGGVGPMTIACLLKNTVKCYKRSNIKNN